MLILPFFNGYFSIHIFSMLAPFRNVVNHIYMSYLHMVDFVPVDSEVLVVILTLFGK
jgi:hypothetical protein